MVVASRYCGEQQPLCDVRGHIIVLVQLAQCRLAVFLAAAVDGQLDLIQGQVQVSLHGGQKGW
jgi:hypothetical protein